MIEVNLLPGAKRRRKRRPSRAFRLPGVDRLPTFDRWLVFVVAAWILAPAIGGWMYLGASGRRTDLGLSIEQAVQDSTRYARIIEATNRLQARRDTIAEKLRIIQEIDADRYVWPHILDEVGRAMPDYTWLSNLYETRLAPLPVFRVEGYTATTLALTRFMTDLEASPFIGSVTLAESQLVQTDGELVYRFALEAAYEQPSPDVLRMESILIMEDSLGTATD